MLTYLTYIDYFKYTTTTDTYTLSLHDALPILVVVCMTRLRINHLKNGFYEVNKLHIRLYKLASSVNVVGAEIAQAERFIVVGVKAVFKSADHIITQFLQGPGLYGAVRDLNNFVIIFPFRDQAGIGGAFALSVKTDQRFKKVHISQLSDLFALATYLHGSVKSFPNLRIMFILYPDEDQIYVSCFKGFDGSLYDRAVHGITMCKSAVGKDGTEK